MNAIKPCAILFVLCTVLGFPWAAFGVLLTAALFVAVDAGRFR